MSSSVRLLRWLSADSLLRNEQQRHVRMRGATGRQGKTENTHVGAQARSSVGFWFTSCFSEFTRPAHRQ